MNKILVTYATRAGSTAEVAARVAAILSQQGLAVDLLPVKKVAGLAGYQAVVVGSAVKFGAWLPEAVRFVEQHQAALNRVPCAFFCVHLMNLGEDETSRQNRAAYLAPLRKLVTPRQEAFFAGVGDLSKVSLIERIIGKMVKSPEGDLRDWQAIQSWATSLPAAL